MKQQCKTCKKQFIHKNLQMEFCCSRCYIKSLNNYPRQIEKNMWKEFWRIVRRKQIGYPIAPAEEELWKEFNKRNQTDKFTNIRT